MAYEIGTAENYTDLLERLKDFISNPAREIESGDTSISELVAIDSDIESGEPSQAWTIERWDDDRDSAGVGEIEMIAKGPGSGSDEIFVGILTYSSPEEAGDYFNWSLEGYTGYQEANTFYNQPGALSSSYNPRVLLYNSAIDYWFVANGRRFIVVAKVGSIYEACYLGFYLPYGTPSQSQYPLAIGGSGIPSVTRYSVVSGLHSIFVDPGGENLTSSNAKGTLAMFIGLQWGQFANKIERESKTFYQGTWPFISNYIPAYSGLNYNTAYSRLTLNLDGSLSVFPIIIRASGGGRIVPKGVYGELQGVFACSGAGVAAEDIITIDSDEYIIFPNIYRVGLTDYWCLKKE